MNLTLENTFRHESGRMIAALTRCIGAKNLELAETAIQDAFVKALQTWPFEGVPEKPAHWLLKVARNRALDLLKHDSFLQLTEPSSFEGNEKALAQLADESLDAYFADEIADDQLRMIFLCCHDSLSRDMQITLILKTICGFSVPEIARAFLAKEQTIAQRLVRAKQVIREEALEFEVPSKEQLTHRIDAVLLGLYLLFNEGYSAYDGSDLIREDLCKEAIRLGVLLATHTITKSPSVFALLSLMLMHGSRLGARVDCGGNLLLLKDQDRSLWNKEMIHLGLEYLARSIAGEEMTKYHLEAAIAACHSIAEAYESTDWLQILGHYDLMLRLYPSPIAYLNRLVAVLMAEGPLKALQELKAMPKFKELEGYHLYYATAAEIHSRLGNADEATVNYQDALKVVRTIPERRFLESKLNTQIQSID